MRGSRTCIILTGEHRHLLCAPPFCLLCSCHPTLSMPSALSRISLQLIAWRAISSLNVHPLSRLRGCFCSQVIVYGPDGRILWVSANWPGSVHDSAVASELYILLRKSCSCAATGGERPRPCPSGWERRCPSSEAMKEGTWTPSGAGEMRTAASDPSSTAWHPEASSEASRAQQHPRS